MMNEKQVEDALRLALEALEKLRMSSWAELKAAFEYADLAIPCIREALADSALERMAENARELGLDYEPPCKTGSQCTSKCPQCEQTAQQEPVAYSYTSRITGAQGFSHHPMPRFIDSESWDIKPLYTSPPASKPWVGLSTIELDEIDAPIRERGHATIAEIYQAIEAKLREKNA